MQVYPDDSPRQDGTDLREHFALQRTLLSLERTLLAYLRTALALLIAGGSAYHFLQGPWERVLGLVLAASGIVLLGIGLARYATMRASIRRSSAYPGPSEP